MKTSLLALLLITLCSTALTVNWEWAVATGSGNMDRVWDMALDPLGNIYVTGEFVDTLQVGNIIIPGWGLSDIFVAKYTSNGVPVWAKAFGGTEGDVGISIDADAAGNCYITGLIAGSVNFEDEVLTSNGGWDAFILKLDTNGNKVWAHTEGGIEGDLGYGIATMPDGRCFVTGWFGNTIHFHDNTTLTSMGGSDVLIFACDADGNLLWKRRAGGTAVEYGYKIAVDHYGNSYVTGSAGAGSDFSGLVLNGSGAYIVSYDVNGNVRWLNLGANAGVISIAVDRTQSLIEQMGCITGRVTGSATFGDVVLNTIDGSDDAYEAGFQLLTGQWTSVEMGGGTGSDKGKACTFHYHPYYTGSFETTADLFGFYATSMGAGDMYVHSDGFGTESWLLTAGGINNIVPVDLAVDADGNVFVCGWFSGIMRFGSNLLIDSGDDSDLDMFLAKINTSTSADDFIAPVNTGTLRSYPNPFRDRISIEIDAAELKNEHTAGLCIYNVKGEKVRTLALSRRDGNTLQAEWNGLSEQGLRCSAGVYFVKANGTSGKAAKILLMN